MHPLLAGANSLLLSDMLGVFELYLRLKEMNLLCQVRNKCTRRSTVFEKRANWQKHHLGGGHLEKATILKF